jgi:hypothetical protein
VSSAKEGWKVVVPTQARIASPRGYNIVFVDWGRAENKNSKLAEPSLTVRPIVPIMPAPSRSARAAAEVSRSRHTPCAVRRPLRPWSRQTPCAVPEDLARGPERPQQISPGHRPGGPPLYRPQATHANAPLRRRTGTTTCTQPVEFRKTLTEFFACLFCGFAPWRERSPFPALREIFPVTGSRQRTTPQPILSPLPGAITSIDLLPRPFSPRPDSSVAHRLGRPATGTSVLARSAPTARSIFQSMPWWR